MSESLSIPNPIVDSAPRRRRLSIGARLALVFEVVRGGLLELWSHKLRSLLTLTLLMLGVFALVVMTSVLDGVKDKIATGFAGMSWDGTLMIAPREAKTSDDQKRFAMSPGLRYEDLQRITQPHEKILASRRGRPSAAWCASPAAPSASS
jgi:putative ABC transport system permease protein